MRTGGGRGLRTGLGGLGAQVAHYDVLKSIIFLSKIFIKIVNLKLCKVFFRVGQNK